MFLKTPDLGWIHVSISDPTTYRISAGGKIFTFEWHHYCGPTVVKKNGDIAKQQPNKFLYAASQWNAQGRKMDENGLCIWFHEPKHKLKHLWGNHYEFLGYEEPEKGS